MTVPGDMRHARFGMMLSSGLESRKMMVEGSGTMNQAQQWLHYIKEGSFISV